MIEYMDGLICRALESPTICLMCVLLMPAAFCFALWLVG